MKILGLNRVELLVPDRDLDAAVARFNDVFGFQISRPHLVAESRSRSAIDFAAGIEFVAPMDERSAIYPSLQARGRGALLTIVWEVDDIASARRWAEEKGLGIRYTYEGTHDGAQIKQLCLEESEFFGYTITLMEKRT
jgi:catechol 2,3-dioxygenase-like lactoylglutathione lyase family enzyme